MQGVREISMNSAMMNHYPGLLLKLKTRHLAVLGVTATFLAIRVVESLMPTLAG